MRRQIVVTTLAAVTSFGLVACSEEQRDDLGQTVDSLAEDVQDVANTVVSNAQNAAGDVIDAAAETAARNFAAVQGKAEFEAAGHPITGAGLACESSVTDDATAVEISCVGTTEADEDAMLTGVTSELPGVSLTELKGQFTGTVDGTEVFTTDQLGG